MCERYGMSAEIDPARITLYEMGEMVRDLRRFGVDDEGEDFSLTYNGCIWVSDLLEEQVIEVIRILEFFGFKITYLYSYDRDGDDVDVPIYDSENDTCTVKEALENHLREIPDGQTRIEDFGDDEDED